MVFAMFAKARGLSSRIDAQTIYNHATSRLAKTHRTTGCLDDRLLTRMTDTGFYVP